jgi:hypothetical protein
MTTEASKVAAAKEEQAVVAVNAAEMVVKGAAECLIKAQATAAQAVAAEDIAAQAETEATVVPATVVVISFIDCEERSVFSHRLQTAFIFLEMSHVIVHIAGRTRR